MSNTRILFIPAPARIFAQPWAWLCALLLFFCPALFATPLTIDSHTSSYAVVPHIDFLEDASGALTIAEVASPTWDEKFRPVATSGNNDINFGYSNSAYWLRLVTNTPTRIPNDLLLEVG